MTTLASSVEPERAKIDQLDVESRAWLDGLRSTGAGRTLALERLHDLLLRAAHSEANRRRHLYPEIGGAELEDVCRQAADDAVVAVTGKLDGFRGASRFTTWAYGFAVFEISVKLRRHAWRGRTIPTADDDAMWNRLAAGGSTAQARIESADLLRRPSPRGRRGAVAPSARGVRRGRAERCRDRCGRGALAVDPRRGLQGAPRRTAEAPPAPRARRTLGTGGGEMNERDPLTQLLGTPGEDAGCEGGLALLAEYVEGELAGLEVRELFPDSRRAPR